MKWSDWTPSFWSQLFLTTLFHIVRKIKGVMLPISSLLKKCSQVEFIAEHFMKCSFITTEKKIVRSKRRGVFIFLLLTGIVYITFLASSPQWSLKMHRYVILLANTYWTNYRKTLVDTCKEKLSNATRRAVMGLGKEETPPPGPFPALPHCLGLSLGVTRNPSSLLLVGDLMRSPSPPSLPQPRMWMWPRFPFRKSCSSRGKESSCLTGEEGVLQSRCWVIVTRCPWQASISEMII